MNKETEKLLVTFLKKAIIALDKYIDENKDNTRIIVVNSIYHGQSSMRIYKTTSDKFKESFYYDTDIAVALNLDYKDSLDMSYQVTDFLDTSKDFKYLGVEYAENYPQKELWRIENIEEFLSPDSDDFDYGGSVSDVFNFRLCVKKYIIPKYKNK